MINAVIGGGIASIIMYGVANWKETDLRKIKHVFHNTNYKVGDFAPKLVRKTSRDDKTEYVFSVPYGLVDREDLQPILEKTLAKDVEVKFRGKLIIYVYNKRMPTRISYDWEETEKWTVPIGESREGMVVHDFDKIPHMTIAGMTRYGKTVLLKLLFAHIINGNPSAEFYVLDLKGGLEFGKYENLSQVREVASDVGEALETLSHITSEIKSDMQTFKSRGINNIVNSSIDRRRFIIVDEGAELDAKCQDKLSEVARIGGALGYRLIYATQYPTADTLPRQIKQNSDAKISFRLPTKVASRVAVDENGAEDLAYPGRAIYRTHDRKIIQVPFVDDSEIYNRLRRFEDATIKNEDKPSRKNIIELG